MTNKTIVAGVGQGGAGGRVTGKTVYVAIGGGGGGRMGEGGRYWDLSKMDVPPAKLIAWAVAAQDYVGQTYPRRPDMALVLIEGNQAVWIPTRLVVTVEAGCE